MWRFSGWVDLVADFGCWLMATMVLVASNDVSGRGLPVMGLVVVCRQYIWIGLAWFVGNGFAYCLGC